MSTSILRNFSNAVRKITVYETRDSYHFLGSDDAEKLFFILEVSRTDPGLLITGNHEYLSSSQVNSHFSTIRRELRLRAKDDKADMPKIASGYGLLGFVRFLEGYHFILIRGRRKAAFLGEHTIYKVEDTAIHYIPNESTNRSSISPKERKYLKMFQNVDLSSNFYFSYTYDITHSVQYNSVQFEYDADEKKVTGCGNKRTEERAMKPRPQWKFVWNEYLLQPVLDSISPHWILPMVHGFVGQSNLVVYGSQIYITLIARRSARFAGPRFLKRGANYQGDIANEVETEQIAALMKVSKLSRCPLTAFVHLRGSIPTFWSQDISRVMTRPPITIDRPDPYAEAACVHFNELLQRYGAPLIVLTLVKRRAKKKIEKPLNDAYVDIIAQLNQTLPPDAKIKYIAFDMARANKKKGSEVLARLDGISEKCINRTSLFSRHCSGFSDTEQKGTIRTNCIDCLDRTNTAQFAIGKLALAFQLHRLGVIRSPDLQFETDCVRLLEDLYEALGDTIALQYGGSQLVHRVQTYRKGAPLTTHTKDILETLRRYYNNSYSDAEKQQSLNIFLGVYRPSEDRPAAQGGISLSQLSYSDGWYDRRDRLNENQETSGYRRKAAGWLEPGVVTALPLPYLEVNKIVEEKDTIALPCPSSSTKELLPSWFEELYRVTEYSTLRDLYDFQMSNSIRNFMPKSVPLYKSSPFEVRPSSQWGFRSTSKKPAATQKERPSLQTSLESRGSDTSSSSECDDSDVECTVTSPSEASDDELASSTGRKNRPFRSLYNSFMLGGHTDIGDPYGVGPSSDWIRSHSVYESHCRAAGQRKGGGTGNQSATDDTCGVRSRLPSACYSTLEVSPPVVLRSSLKLYKHAASLSYTGGVIAVPAANIKCYRDSVAFLSR